VDAKSSAVVAVAFAGALVAMQAPINGKLGSRMGTLQAASLSFAVGLVLLLALVIVAGNVSQLGEARHLPWWYFLGGALGAVYVSTVLASVDRLGAGGVTAATIAGQLSFSLVIDHYGWLGVDRQPINAARAAGVVLLAVGVVLVVRD
jgi:transporter family-2 protein